MVMALRLEPEGAQRAQYRSVSQTACCIFARPAAAAQLQQEAVRATKKAWKEKLTATAEKAVLEKVQGILRGSPCIRLSGSPGPRLQDMAAIIKKHMDKFQPNTTWHCIVGTHFAVSISHATRHLIFLSVNNSLSVLLFRSIE